MLPFPLPYVSIGEGGISNRNGYHWKTFAFDAAVNLNKSVTFILLFMVL